MWIRAPSAHPLFKRDSYPSPNTTYDCESLTDESTESYLDAKIPNRPVNALIIMLASFSVLGLLGNSLVLYVYVRKRNKLSSTVFIIALAVNDLVTSAVTMPYTMVQEVLNYYILYDFACKLYYFFITCTIPFSVFIMVAIATDRYICICLPHSHVLDSRRARNTVLVLLFLAVLIGVIPTMFYGVYQDTKTLWKEEVRRPHVEKWVRKNLQNTSVVFNHEESKLDIMVIDLYMRVCNRANPPNASYVYTGQCLSNQIIFSDRFRFSYQTVYSSSFLICFSIVFVLYILIYRSVLVRRARRYASRTQSKQNHTQDYSLTENQSMLNESPDKSIAMTELQNGPKDDSAIKSQTAVAQSQSLLKEQRKPSGQLLEGSQKNTPASTNGCLRDKYFLANIRTAVMLFVVTVVFIIAYLPSWLIAHKLIPFNVIVFYVYFCNHIVNPIIYAFMNPAFRRSLKALICRKPILSM